LGDSTIGIKVADGTYYPVLEHGFTGRKKLVLTTAKDNQARVQIDLYRGNGSTLSQARYIGSLIIENIPAAAQGQPEIELFIGIDDDGQLSAEANDTSTGESQRFATSLTTLPESQALDDSDFVLEGEMPDSYEEPAAAGEEDAEAEIEKTAERRRRGPNLLLLILFVVLGVLLVAAVAYFVYRSIQGPQIPALPSTTQSQPAAQNAQPASQAAPAPAPAPAAPAVKPAPQEPVAQAKPAPVSNASYLIKRGDTLWDLASTYYRNPWLYPKLAKANGIRNPDLIFAGTRITVPAN
jgi:nucleoid-associated protein YgaU